MIRLFRLLGLFVLSAASAQQYQVEVYGLSRGLPQSQVTCLGEDPLGGIWIGTAGGGMAHFNGSGFEVINRSKGMPSNSVTDLWCTPDGRLIAASDAGLILYDGFRIVVDASTEGRAVHSLFSPHENELWASAEDSLYRFELAPEGLRKIASYHTPDPFIDLIATAEGHFACGSNRIYRFEFDGEALITEALPYRHSLSAVRFFKDHQDRLAAASLGEGVVYLRTDTLEKSTLLLPKVVNDGLALDHQHSVFASADEGLLLANDSAVTERYDRSKGFPSNKVTCLLRDRWGNLWAGTSGGGLVRMSNLPFKHVYTKDGPHAEAVYAIASRGEQQVLSLGRRGIFHFDGKALRADSSLGERELSAKALLVDRAGRRWVGTEGQGIYLHTNDSLLHLTSRNGLAGAWVSDLCEGPDSSVWAATAGGGITRFYGFDESDGQMRFSSQTFGRGAGLKDLRIKVVEADSSGCLWFGSSTGGLGCIRQIRDKGKSTARWEVLSVKGFRESQGQINDLALSQSTLWVGYSDGSIAWLPLHEEGAKLQSLSLGAPEHGSLYALAAEGEDKLWIGSARGLTRLCISPNHDVTCTEHFQETDGFLGQEVCSKAMAFDAQGRLMVGSMDGFSVWLGQDKPDRKSRPPLVQIRNPHLFYQAFSELPQRIFVGPRGIPRDTLVLTRQQNTLSFDLVASHLGDPKRIQYQHFLVGQDAQWSPLAARSSITYSNLQPGTYTLRAKACVNELCTEARPLTLHILMPFWMKPAFRTAAWCALAAFVLLVFFLILRSVRRRARRKNERLRMERDLIALEQQSLRLQMNPHFIFNTLQSIQGLIAREDPKTARLQLSRFAHLMREILDHSREELITLGDEYATLKRYLELMQFTHGSCFAFHLELPDELSNCLIPPLLLQPFVENGILHGILPAGSGTLSISAYRQDATLVLTVEDDGVGLGASNKPEGHRSAGLEVTRERLALLSAASGIRMEKRPGGGTLVRILLPVEEDEC